MAFAVLSLCPSLVKADEIEPDSKENTDGFIPTAVYAEAEHLADGDNEIFDDLIRLSNGDELAEDILSYAGRYLGVPYRYGASGPRAFDCSGFTSHVFRNFDIPLQRTSRGQYTQGTEVGRDDILPGDLLFFSGRNGDSRVGHVGIATDVSDEGAVRFIHASTSRGIRYDSLDDNYFRRRYIGARRVLPEA